MVIVFDEVDAALMKIHKGVEPNLKMPIAVLDKQGWNHMLDEVQRGMCQDIIIIMTSNIGSQLIQDNYEKAKNPDDAELFDRTKMDVMLALKSSLRPEFLNRIDEVIMFTPLGKSQIENIVKLQLHLLSERLQKADIHLVVTPDALTYLADKGYDPQYGARPVKRTIQKEVMNELSKYILGGKVDKSEAVVLDVFDGQIVFRKKIDAEALIEV